MVQHRGISGGVATANVPALHFYKQYEIVGKGESERGLLTEDAIAHIQLTESRISAPNRSVFDFWATRVIQ
jgi:hypothetical protein